MQDSALGPVELEQTRHLAPMWEDRPRLSQHLPEMVKYAAGDIAAAAVNMFYVSSGAAQRYVDGFRGIAESKPTVNRFTECLTMRNLTWVVDIADFNTPFDAGLSE